MNADVPEENRLRWLTEANWLPVNSFPAIICLVLFLFCLPGFWLIVIYYSSLHL